MLVNRDCCDEAEGGIGSSVAGERDEAADLRDRAADQRDQVADLRDRAGVNRPDQAGEQFEARVRAGIAIDALNRPVLVRRQAASDRRRASRDRRVGPNEGTQAQLDRETALSDRRAGAIDRTQARLDRDTALADRVASAREREHASIDGLTGVYLRGPGSAELEREIARARREDKPLVLAFVDVDHLKTINDSRGHVAGDRMLREVANTLGAKLRSYDLIMRYGGDEFVCALLGLSIADATKRLVLVNAALAEAPEHGSVTVGLADLRPDDLPEDLVTRADAALYRERQQRRT